MQGASIKLPISAQDDYATANVPALAGVDVASAANLFGGARDETKFGGETGLRRVKPFSAIEIARIATLIKERLLVAAREQSRELVDVCTALPLERWHEIKLPYDHGALLSKRNRVLSLDATREIMKMSAFDHLRETFGDFYLYDEDEFGQEEISFRLVRPGKREDVGRLHADDWFWKFYNLNRPAGTHRVKLWTLVHGDAATAGLRLAPGSHFLNATFRSEKQGNKVIFESDVDWRTIGLRQYVGQIGEPILFNHKTLHVGSMNFGAESRVSFETTIMFR